MNCPICHKLTKIMLEDKDKIRICCPSMHISDIAKKKTGQAPVEKPGPKKPGPKPKVDQLKS